MRTKIKQRIRVSKVGEVLLTTIALAGVVTVAVCAPNALQLLKPFFKKKKYSPKQSIKRNIDSLIKTGLVKKTINNQGEVVLSLTRKGVWEHLIRRPDDSKKKVWDGKWRIVIFDVPSTKNATRDQLTHGMRLYGFRLLQRSVWIYPYPCEDFISIIREHFEIKEEVTFLTASTFEHDREWRKEFKV